MDVIMGGWGVMTFVVDCKYGCYHGGGGGVMTFVVDCKYT